MSKVMFNKGDYVVVKPKGGKAEEGVLVGIDKTTNKYKIRFLKDKLVSYVDIDIVKPWKPKLGKTCIFYNTYSDGNICDPVFVVGCCGRIESGKYGCDLMPYRTFNKIAPFYGFIPADFKYLK